MSYQDEADDLKIDIKRVERITLSIDRSLAREILKLADADCENSLLPNAADIRPILDVILKTWPDLASEYSWLF